MFRAVLLAAMLLAGCTAPMAKNVEVTSTASIIRPAKVKVSFTQNSLTTDLVEGDAGVAGRQVKADDPVRVASISKLVAALGQHGYDASALRKLTHENWLRVLAKTWRQ